MKEIREMKLTLRKMDFPALEALKKIGKISTFKNLSSAKLTLIKINFKFQNN